MSISGMLITGMICIIFRPLAGDHGQIWIKKKSARLSHPSPKDLFLINSESWAMNNVQISDRYFIVCIMYVCEIGIHVAHAYLKVM